MALFGFGRNKRSVGLDIGSGFIKVAVVDHSGSLPVVDLLAVSPLSPDAIVEGEIMNPGLVASTIDSLFSELDIDRNNVIVSVGGRDVIIKPIQMDRMSKQDAREVIRWEAEQHVPFDMDDVQLDFEITDPEGEGLQMSVLLVAAKSELIETKLSLLEEARVNPRLIDVDAFALHNALEMNHPEAMKGIAGLINVGHEATTVNILDEGVPVLTRDLNFGTRRLSIDLQREQGLSSEEAEAALRGQNADDRLRAFMYERVQEVGRGIERATAFLETQEMGAKLGRLYLCGGGVRIPALVDAIAERIGVETLVANPLELIEAKAGVTGAGEPELLAPMMMLSVGLALRSAA